MTTRSLARSLRVMCVFGTRPEAIKMAPVMAALAAHPGIEPILCVTGQHRQMLDQVLNLFGMEPHHDLAIMRPGQGLHEITSAILLGLNRVLVEDRPDWLLVHGDTSTTLAASLAAFYERIPVGHVEAGLRTRNLQSPWPEELNRRVAGVAASIHFAPTQRAHHNLLEEMTAPETIHVTGNTGIDAVMMIRSRLETDPQLAAMIDASLPPPIPDRRLVLVTGHRRESFGAGFENICRALKALSERPDVEVIYPVHLNPNVREPVHRTLGDAANIRLIEPLDYLPFVRLMSRAHLIITDSGGVQEEAPSFGIPVLVMRDTTERPEAVEAGTVRLVGSDPHVILREAGKLLDDTKAYTSMARAVNPYGDGKAAPRIASILGDLHERALQAST